MGDGDTPLYEDVNVLANAAGVLGKLQETTPPTEHELAAKASEVIAAAVRARHEEIVDALESQPNDGGGMSLPAEDIPAESDGTEWGWVADKMRYFYERSYAQPSVVAKVAESARKRLSSGYMSGLKTTSDATQHWGVPHGTSSRTTSSHL